MNAQLHEYICHDATSIWNGARSLFTEREVENLNKELEENGKARRWIKVEKEVVLITLKGKGNE